ncbi:uncharacterized protein METZ01_LOCUS265994, partial [marine metagenome]
MKTPNRRKFIKHTTIAAGAAFTLPRAARAVGANEKITVGIIGPGGMGSAHLGTLCQNNEVNIAYVCDVDERRAAKARSTAEKAKGKAPKVVGDMRRIFEDKDVDAVWIATPDHWHAPATILACDAGKHVYV